MGLLDGIYWRLGFDGCVLFEVSCVGGEDDGKGEN